ncbi:MAG: anti-sigma factor [Gemmatimonadales bacterium]
MNDPWTDQLSEYLDDELPADDRASLESHLRVCVACTTALADLKRVAVRARALTDRDPAADLWPGIAERIGSATPSSGVPAVRLMRRSGRRWSFSVPELAAACVALMVLSGGAAWLLHPGQVPLAVAPARAPQAGVVSIPASARAGSVGYDGAVADLERVLTEGRGRLDTATVRVIVRNLAAIDSAIAQAQRAVSADSANLYLNSHLAATRRQKLELLRQAASLVSAVS